MFSPWVRIGKEHERIFSSLELVLPFLEIKRLKQKSMHVRITMDPKMVPNAIPTMTPVPGGPLGLSMYNQVLVISEKIIIPWSFYSAKETAESSAAVCSRRLEAEDLGERIVSGRV